MLQPLTRNLACLFVKDHYLLKAGVKVTTYDEPHVGSFPEPLVFCKLTVLGRSSQRRYEIKCHRVSGARNLLFDGEVRKQIPRSARDDKSDECHNIVRISVVLTHNSEDRVLQAVA